MKNLSDREQNIVLATIRLWNINAKRGYVPDYELIEPAFDLPMEAMRDIRNLVQDVRPSNPDAQFGNEETLDNVKSSGSEAVRLDDFLDLLSRAADEIAYRRDNDDPTTLVESDIAQVLAKANDGLQQPKNR
jgi:hypothetical protein